MTRSPRAFGLVTAVLLMAMPSTAGAAAIYRFSGAGDGGIVWDGSGDVGTMQQDCANLNRPGETCGSAPAGFPPSPIIANVVFDDVVKLDGFELFLALSVPTGTCAAHSLACDPIDDVFKSAHDLSERPGYVLDPSADFEVALFPFSIPVQPISGYSGTLNLQLAGGDAAALELWPGAMVGFIINFQEIDRPVVDNETQFVKLTVDIPVGAAPVPEPASMLLLGTGLAGVFAKRYRRRHSSSLS